MDKRDTYSKYICGPGGINCSCCRVGTKQEAKRGNARGKRRASKIALKKEVSSSVGDGA